MVRRPEEQARAAPRIWTGGRKGPSTFGFIPVFIGVAVCAIHAEGARARGGRAGAADVMGLAAQSGRSALEPRGDDASAGALDGPLDDVDTTLDGAMEAALEGALDEALDPDGAGDGLRRDDGRHRLGGWLPEVDVALGAQLGERSAHRLGVVTGTATAARAVQASVGLRWALDRPQLPRADPLAPPGLARSTDGDVGRGLARDDDDEVARGLFAGEPTIAEVRGAALVHLRATPGAAEALQGRARASAWVPRVTLGAQGTLGRDKRVVVDLDGAASHTATGDDAQSARLGVALTWDLAQAIFHPTELALEREAVRAALWRARVLDDVTGRFYERRRLALDLALDPPKVPVERLHKEQRLEELTAELDGRTGGLWTARTAAVEPAAPPVARELP